MTLVNNNNNNNNKGGKKAGLNKQARGNLSPTRGLIWETQERVSVPANESRPNPGMALRSR